MDEQTQQPSSETEPKSEPITTPSAPAVVDDLQTYQSLVRAKAAESRAKAEPAPAVKPRDGQGRFAPSGKQDPEPTGPEAAAVQGEPAPETEGAAEPAQQTAPAQPAKPPEPAKIDLLRQRVAAERERRRQESESKRALAEYRQHLPMLQGLQTSKVSTVDQLLTDEEFTRLCDLRIARVKGQPAPAEAVLGDVQKRLDAKLQEIDRRERETTMGIAKMNFSRIVDSIAPANPDYELAKEWVDAQGQTFAQTCIDYVEAVFAQDHNAQGPTPEQARDAVISYALEQIEMGARIKQKRAAPAPAVQAATEPDKAQPAAKETKPKPRTLSSTLKGSSARVEELPVTNHESYAELVKAKRRAAAAR